MTALKTLEYFRRRPTEDTLLIFAYGCKHFNEYNIRSILVLYAHKYII